MNNRGFSLVEILVAITLIAIALWSLVIIMGTGFTNVFTSSHKNQAIYKAQDAIEEKINQIEEQIASGSLDSGEGVSETIEINISGNSIFSDGIIIFSQGEEKGVSSMMITFIPEGVENNE